MTELSVDCGKCGTKGVGAKPRGAYAFSPTTICMFATCNRCHAGLVLYGPTKGAHAKLPGTDLFSGSDGRQILDDFSIEHVYPAAPEPRQIEYLPDNVASAFRQAEGARALTRNLNAAGSYRAALERALKHRYPEAEKRTLYERIERIAAKNAIPKEMIDLMHEVRFLGNEIHAEEDPTAEDIEAGADFTALLLTYLFELPGRVDAARERRAGKN